jgi:hypothetical protein
MKADMEACKVDLKARIQHFAETELVALLREAKWRGWPIEDWGGRPGGGVA